MLFNLNSPIIQPFDLSAYTHQDLSLHIKRDDLIHPVVSGNKVFKLNRNVEAFLEGGFSHLVTFGGAYSNHLHATAYVGEKLNIPCIGVVRGEQILPLNPTLKDCVNWGMELYPVSRKQYKQMTNGEIDLARLDQINKPYYLPEGGANELGVRGAGDILASVDQSKYDYVVLAAGTGTTMAGVVNGAQSHVNVLGFAVLKAHDWLCNEVQKWSVAGTQLESWALNSDYHFGGYAKTPKPLLEFMLDMQTHHGLLLDKIYSAKAFYGLLDLISKGYFGDGSRILFIHCGGLQGNRSDPS